MSHFSKVVLLSIITILLLPAVQAEQTFPIEPEGEWYVLDAADVFDDQTEIQMSSELSDIRNRTNTLVRVVTIESMADYGVEKDREYFMGDSGYARQMFQHYGMEGNEEKAIMITF
ncbi:MAG: TPM domain-containing protein, partial [Candidatus Poseidoniaceae archaeon]|nr:TPM domain-containing protein [Candidatus Poseidoniaceae archaeon]